MFHRFGRHIRPLVCKLNQRSLCWKRNLPIHTPWKTRSPYFDVWWDARNIDRHFEKMWRDFDRMVGPSFFDAYYVRPRDVEARTEVSKLKYDSEGFELRLDVQQFTPSELNVKLVGNTLTVSGKHEQKADEHGHISREFHRELTVPEDVDLESMTSSISEDGILTITADVKGAEKPAEKVIDIHKEQKD
ncbi:alpha-crystallin B chain-like [Mercenaria mercenaria]|uniref:alpha-crystallin B chain-like n=1 Tax=Mercenaria mercenaria TaxID=6596 RepID=UPI00234F733C|nr:alpha-crystallin B chain-like [Mercenaria mercenaria]